MSVLKRISNLDEENPFSNLSLKYGFCGKKKDENFISSFYSLKQVHGTKLVEAPFFSAENPKADALFTEQKGKIIAIKTADCLPILISDSLESFVLAIHAGWRGLAAGIITNSLQALNKDYSKVRVLMGPYIHLESFEVGPEVLEAFSLHSAEVCDEERFISCYRKGNKDRYHFDLAEFAFVELTQLGVPSDNIAAFGGCTLSQESLWHSSRRDKEAKGRNWSWISL